MTDSKGVVWLLAGKHSWYTSGNHHGNIPYMDNPQAATQTERTRELFHTLRGIAAYIPGRLVRTQLADPQPGRIDGLFWQGSLLFADLSGFTAFSEQLSVLGKQGAEEVSAVVSQLFDALIAEIDAHHGMLLKFGGDALTAFFDADTLGTLHAAAATQSALAMQQRMAAFAAVPTRAGTFRLGLRVGVHSGRVFAAEVGDESHIELVITGAEVNRVAQAQEIAAPGEVVISHQTAALLEGAQVLPRQEGFLHITDVSMVPLPTPASDMLPEDPDDYTTDLDLLTAQVSALRTYLVRGLPRRFLTASIAETGEFRPVTVVFVHIYDFSARLLAGFGDDAARAAVVFNAYFCRLQTVVHQYGGIVNKVDMYTHGDKLMVLFGAPTAHEDDAIRAVRCALEFKTVLLEAEAEVAAMLEETRHPACDMPPPILQHRIGISTGTVFAGRVGGTRRYEYTVMGSTVNLAARLMSAAPDNVILLSPATRALVANQIKIEDHTPLKLKGMREPIVPGCAVCDFSEEQGEQHARHFLRKRGQASTNQRSLVGRDTELAHLKAEATTALHGDGRVLALVGDAGVGKTRLAEELVYYLEAMQDTQESHQQQQPAAVPRYRFYEGVCLSHEQRTPYSAIRVPLRYLLDAYRDDQADASRIATDDDALWLDRSYRARVKQLAPRLVRFTPLLGDVLGIPLSETPLTRSLTAEQRHDRVQDLIVALVLGAAEHEPLVCMLDGVHLADTSSLALLHRLAEAATQVPLLLLLTYRLDPPFDELWADLPGTARVLLSGLSSDNSTLLLTTLLGGTPPEAMLSLLERAQGNPFFIEELVRALVDSGALSRDTAGHWHLTRSLEQVALPNSIEGLLLARLDRLDEPQYELVQVASVIGRRFEHAVLERIYSQPVVLPEQIERLIHRDVIVRMQQDANDQRFDALVYLFHNELLRDVAYEGILYARRRELHERIAQCIEMLGADRLDEYLALLAQHYLLAEHWMPAFTYHLAAGIQSQSRYANRDALALFTTALQIAPNIQDQQGIFSQMIEIHERGGSIQALLGEYDAAQAMYADALELLNAWRQERGLWKTTPDEWITLPPEFAIPNMRLHRLLASVQELRSNYESATDWLERGIAWTTDETQDELARCYLLGAGIYQRQGQNAQALEWAQRGLKIFEQQGSQSDLAHAYYAMGGIYRKLGRSQDAIAAVETSLQLYTETENIAGQANAHLNLANALADIGHWQAAIVHGQSALELKETIGDVYGQAIVANNLGDFKRKMGDYVGSMRYLQVALDQFAVLGSDYGMAVLHMNIGSVSISEGMLHEAQYHLDQSRALFAQTGTEEFLAELYCAYAELALAQQQLQQALSWADESLQLAQRLDARADEGSARRMRGLIFHALGSHPEAITDLRQAYYILLEVDNQHAASQCLRDLTRLTEDPPESLTVHTES